MIPFLNNLAYKYNLKEQELAKKIGISRSQLYRIKKTGKIGSKALTGLKNAFPEVDLNELIKNFKQVGGISK
jgi:DNA-binding Xre family transcriptional regulator